MRRSIVVLAGLMVGIAGSSVGIASGAAAEPAGKPWVEQSNAYTQQLLDVQFAHGPESGSQEGLVKYDDLISIPTLADQMQARHELEVVVAKLKTAQATTVDKNVKQDLQILAKSFDLAFRQEDYNLAHEVPFANASAIIFQGLRGLLDDQVDPARRPSAVKRLKKYAGLEAGYKPYTEILKQRAMEQAAKPGVIYPSRAELETELGRDPNYVNGIADLFTKYKLDDWGSAYAQLKIQMADYDDWLRANILPKSRADFRLAPQAYALAMESYGIDLQPAEMAKLAHAAFAQYQAEIAPLAAQIATAYDFPDKDYRAVIVQLKHHQIVGDKILPFFEKRLHDIEQLIVAHDLVTLPSRAAVIRLATPAETVQIPAPHMTQPPLLHNTGQRGEFVLPLNIPSANGGAEDVYDDFTVDAVAWTLTAHEARPGHELQFDSMVEHGVSVARALYAFNSTNVEGWGLYSEWLIQPYEPVEGQLFTLQFRLLRAARAFLDPELQSGVVTPEQAYAVLEKDVGLSHAFAKEEIERFTFQSPGQANSYFYGYTKLLQLRKDTEIALGPKFNAKRFHDFILAQGLLPPELMRAAVMQDFVPTQR